ncbi:vWA domain-containing protein [Caloramator sp. ALD01]|uniref:VWA domain-containing protein n=1 Tax=Caloramator sp. ALD01 TaxID=1031288 RepID=UPI00041523C2|nr:vWA domain-containing protein [Caloramator sp. ALD01]
MKKRILALVLVLAIVLGIGWSRMTKASGVQDFSAKILTQSELIRIGQEVELQFNYKINGQGNNISNICITYPIPANFEVSTLPDRWNIVGNTLKGNDLNFNPNGSISFSVKLKSKSIGKLENFGIATLTYNYNKGNDKTKDVTSETLTDQVKLFNRVSNAPLSSLIIDPTNINIEANIKNRRTDENGNGYIYLDEPLEVEYKLTPQGEINVDRNPVDIVLVVDTSGSMQMTNTYRDIYEIDFDGYVKRKNTNHIYKYIVEKYYRYYGIWEKYTYYTDSKAIKEYYYNRVENSNLYYKSYDNQQYINTKMYKTILAAKNLINKMSDESKGKDDKVAIVDFDTRVNNPNDSLLSINSEENKQILLNRVDRMFGNGGTNIYEGLLIAEKHLDADSRDVEKHIIVLTDGMPTFYVNGNTINDYKTKYGENIKVFGDYLGPGNKPDEITKSITKNKVSELKSKYKVHFVALNTEVGDIDVNFFNQIKQIEAGISEIIDNADNLQSLFNEIYKSITKSTVYTNIKLEQNLPSKLQVEEVYVNGIKLDNTQYSIENGKLNINLDSIVFENKKGTPSPVTINVKYKSNDTGVINLNEAIISGQKLVEGLSYDYTNSCQIGSIEIRSRDFYNYVNFNKIEINRNLIPNNTYVTVKVDITNRQLFNMDSNARVELILTPITDGDVETTKDGQQNNFLFNASAESRSDRFKFRITDDNVKDKEVTLRVTAIKVTYKGVEYNITQDIYKYFGNETPSIPVMVKKFTLR